MAANEVAKSEEEGEDAASRTIEEHGGVAKEHGDEEVEVGGDAEGEVGEGDADDGGVEVLGEAAGEEAAEEAEGHGGGEAEEEAEHGDRDSDGSGHRIHGHGCK